MAVIIVIVVIALFVGYIIIKRKINNKIHQTVMKETGLGDAMNEHFDKLNAEALAKVEEMYKNGEISQEDYERRKKNLSTTYDFNK